MKILPASSIKGRMRLPGDKSISHRAAMLASIANGTTNITNFATSADCASTLSCIEGLGIEVGRAGTTVTVNGRGKIGLAAPSAPLDCGNSGTSMRLLAGILAGQPFDSVLIGDDSLQSRPMKRIIEPLTQMGGTIGSYQTKAPLRISGNPALMGIQYVLPVPSAQVKSCVLLAGLFSKGVTTVIEPSPTRDHTERMLRWFGVDVVTDEVEKGFEISVSGDSELNAHDIVIPGDPSSAAFFAVAAAALPGSDLVIENVGINPSRIEAVRFLEDSGAPIELASEGEINNEPFGSINVNSKESEGSGAVGKSVISGPQTAALIDEIPILAVFGTQLANGLEIRDARELRVKESDRIRTVVTNLQRMGADVEEFEDGMRIGPSELTGAEIETFGDHRIAMAFAVAALLASGETTIRGSECVDVSFPGFFDELERVAQR
jgi:3-phosphoshikimate 1-carboxyvinyltransferase